MKREISNKKGFTLIELVIVVAIIAILAAISIPQYLNYQCKSKQVEARNILGSVSKLQEIYYSNHNTYTADLSELGIPPRGSRIHYDYAIVSADASTYTAQATGKAVNSSGISDVWTVNQSVILTNTTNACR